MNLKEFIQENKSDFDKDKISSKADVNFENLLKNKLHQPKKKRKLIYLKEFTIAACLTLIFTIIFWQKDAIFNNQKSEILANLDNESAGKRLEGVYNFSDEYKKEDAKIISSLLKLLHKDENTNVKIATIEALLKFPKNERIRVNLINALATEKDPLIQIKLIKSMPFLRDNRAQKPLKEIINNSQTFPIVKSNATLAMAEIKQ